MKIYILLIFLLFSSLKLFAQNLPEQDCSGAIPVCQPTYSQANSYTGYGNTQELDDNNNDCMYSYESNSVWYIINTSSAGTLEFTITPNSPNDYDFAVWDATGVGCAALVNTPIRCNYAGMGTTPANGATGLSSGAGVTLTSGSASDTSFCIPINVLSGQTYLLLVNNYIAGSTIGYTLDFSASTASILDTLPPYFVSAHTKCDLESDTLNVNMSEPIKCASLAPDGSDFYITPAVSGLSISSAYSSNCAAGGLFTNNFSLQFSGTIPAGTYWLHPQVGIDTNTVLDNCDNPQLLTDSIQFIVNPSALYMVQLDTPACINATVKVSRPIRCNTVALDGSDFSIAGSSIVGIKSALPVNCNTTSDMTDQILIVFDTSVIVPGTYTLSVKIGTDGNGILDTCGSSVSNTISWVVSDKGIDAYASPNLLCNPGYTNLYSNTSLAPSAEGYNYTWSPGVFLNDSTQSSTLGYIPHTDVYMVQMLDEHYCFRRDTTNVLVSVRYPVLSEVKDTQLCIGQSVEFYSSGGQSYFWYPAEGLSCVNCPSPIAMPQTTTRYFVVISDEYNCGDTLAKTLVVHPLPVINAIDDTTIFYGDVIQLYTNADNPAIYAWSPPNWLSNPNIFNPLAAPEQTIVYTVKAIDDNNCTNTDSVKITVRTDIPVDIPNAFTPNGDGKNDVFHISYPKFEKLQEFRVFNRWGKEVFSTNNVQDGWDGSYNGVPQDMGVYNYVIKVSFPDGRVETYKGTVTLVR